MDLKISKWEIKSNFLLLESGYRGQTSKKCFNIVGTVVGDQKNSVIKADSQQGFEFFSSQNYKYNQLCSYTSAECLHLNKILVKLI